MNKVINGTPNHSEATICATCRNSAVVQGHRLTDYRIFCRAITGYTRSAELTSAVTTCTLYDDARMPSRYDLEQIAWVITTSPSRRVGFLSPQERHAMHAPAMPPPFAKVTT
jgi:hypothetical protein